MKLIQFLVLSTLLSCNTKKIITKKYEILTSKVLVYTCFHKDKSVKQGRTSSYNSGETLVIYRNDTFSYTSISNVHIALKKIGYKVPKKLLFEKNTGKIDHFSNDNDNYWYFKNDSIIYDFFEVEGEFILYKSFKKNNIFFRQDDKLSIECYQMYRYNKPFMVLLNAKSIKKNALTEEMKNHFSIVDWPLDINYYCE
jgi:hypothetical protein